MLGLGPNLDYSQAALSYRIRMEAAIALELKFDKALELVQEQLVCSRLLTHHFCKLVQP